MKKKLLAAAVVLTAVLMLGGCEGLSAKNAKGPETEESCLSLLGGPRKTKRYKKPISKEVAKLLQSSIEYTQEKFGDAEYIFVNEKEPDRPMQYMAIKTKVMSMIQEKQLKDDHGELFGFGTHMFRHYYGVKLTEMHLDDWTIARLLGHKRLNNVQHYRKMSNQRMADETREVRQMMSDIIYMSLAGWGEEYEQIRQDD